jgi:hypothetical protein
MHFNRQLLLLAYLFGLHTIYYYCSATAIGFGAWMNFPEADYPSAHIRRLACLT